MKITTSVKEACEMVGIGKTKLYELVARGEVKTTKVGSRRLVHMDSIHALLR